MGFARLMLASMLSLFAASAFAQDAASSGNVASGPTPICTDRPTKANAPCTVPTGDFQIESDAVSWTRTRRDGVRTDTIAYTAPYLKYGVGSHTDIEASLIPYETIRTHQDGRGDTIGGIGDLTLRVKQGLVAGGGGTHISLIPFVKVPTAKSGIGNEHWEGGVIVPVNVPLPGGFSLTVDPELDILADGAGSGRHVALTTPINIAHGLARNLTGYAELWTAQDLDPGGHTRQYSADFAIAYLLTPTLQLDAGANIGLSRDTPDRQLYVGISTRL